MADISKIQLPDGNQYDVKDTTKQPLLVSGTNIKTINNNSLLGSGNISIEATVAAMTDQEIEDAVDAGWAVPSTVTISLTNPRHSSDFISCDIYGHDVDDPSSQKTLLGTIDSPTGSVTVSIDQPYLEVYPQSASSIHIPYSSSTIITTGDVAWDGILWSTSVVIFAVNGNGTATIDRIDYDY